MTDKLPDLVISKVNETFIKINCEKSTARELADHFSFFAPGYKHMPMYKNKIWDGKIRLFDTRKYQIYKGLYQKVLDFAKENGYSVHSTFQLPNNSITLDQTKELFRLIGGGYVPHEHQALALQLALQYQHVLILSPTSSGKSYTIYNLIRVLKKTGKGLLVVPSINLVSQMKADFVEYSSKNGWDVEKNCHQIMQGAQKFSEKPVYISTWQSLQTMKPGYFEQFAYLIVDEAHQAKANEIRKIAENAINAHYKIGITGTLDGELVNELTLNGLFGETKEVITTAEMIDAGLASELSIRCILMHYDKSAREMLKLDFAGQTNWLISNEKRNRFISNVVSGETGNKLVLFQQVEKHGLPLYKSFKKEYPNIECYFISGMTPLAERETIRKRLSEATDIVLFASYGVYAQGMNVPSLQHVFSTAPGKSRVRILQSIGRALRLHKDKNEAIFWDFADKIGTDSRVNIGYKHFEERLSLYMKQKFNLKQYDVHIKT